MTSNGIVLLPGPKVAAIPVHDCGEPGSTSAASRPSSTAPSNCPDAAPPRLH
ncbi:hypothetical protein [Streptomyces sp. MZ04]|uniref:hypothetical protein n=1 Tax=Streptomyces sp. MZ04 TaxID=2559236 RepID=UPI001432AAF1|nr:hypothetical protein [Streptomyces sp. MZ04]